MNLKFYKALVAILFTGILHASAQSDSHIDVAFDVRADYLVTKAENADPVSGFHGRYLNLMLNGSINSQLSYSWRQRMNKFAEAPNDIFAATDWVYLRYQPVKNWAFAGGKQVVLIGGYEYDAKPINVFFASRFWNNIACYQFGASATYISDNGQHELTFQICNSPYMNTQGNGYAYNIYWSGHMGCYSTLWSVNMVEYKKGYFANFIALGNRFELGDLDLQIDLMNRATRHHAFIAGDYTVIGKAIYTVSPHLSIFAKGGYDQFKSIPAGPEHVDNPFFGGGIEFYPLNGGSRDLRLHAVCDRISDNEGISSTEFNVGITWNVNVYRR